METTYMNLLDETLRSQAFWAIGTRMAVVVLITLVVARTYHKVSRRSNSNNKIHLKFIHNIVVLCIYVLGIIVAMAQIPNFSKGISTLLAGSGILALTLGLAAQESLGNAINGLFISMFRPFEVGDRVRLVNGNITGYIEDITLRHTVIRTFMNSRIIVPNTTMNKDMVENSNFMNARASSFIDVIITYDSNMALAQSIMAEIVAAHPDFVDTRGPDQMSDPKVKVYVRNLGVYGVELRTSMWTHDINNNFGASSDVRESIKIAFDKAGIVFAHTEISTGPKPE